MRGTVIVCFHGICAEAGEATVPDTLSQNLLADGIRWMQTIGPIVPLSESLAGRGSHPSFSLVFDDATASVARVAAPLLEAEGVPWAVAVPTAFVGSGRPLWIRDFDWVLRRTGRRELSIPWRPGASSEVVSTNGGSGPALERFRRMHFSSDVAWTGTIVRRSIDQLPTGDPARSVPDDIRIGDAADLEVCVGSGATLVSHGAHHLPLPFLSAEEVVREWREARDWLRTRFGGATLDDALVAPYGRVAPHADAALRAAGCRFVLTGRHGVAGASVDPHRVPRIPGATASVAGFAARVVRHARPAAERRPASSELLAPPLVVR